MKALSACVVVLCAAALAAGVESGHACSCALPDPRIALAGADGAFVGKLVARREVDFRAVLTFSVERSLKGNIGTTAEVVTASNSAACGIEAPIGTRVGLVLDRRDGAWHGHLCWVFGPADLLAAAKPLPAPTGRGPAALVVAGQFGPMRLLALDGKGLTLAYGRGLGTATASSVCPGGRRVAEIAFTGSAWELAVRELPSLRARSRQLVTLPGGRRIQSLLCEDGAGTSMLVFARGMNSDSPVGSAVYRLVERQRGVLWTGPAFDAALTLTAAYLSAGMSGRNLLRVDAKTRRVAKLATLPGSTTSLKVDARSSRLAGVHTRLDRPSQIVLVDLSRRPGKVTTSELSAAEVSGDVAWLPSGRLLFLPWYGRDSARVFDRRLRTISQFGWQAEHGTLVGSTAFGVSRDGTLVSATAPGGPSRVVRRLPGRPEAIGPVAR